MLAIAKWLRSFLLGEEAPTFFEYALLVVVIAMVVVLAAVAVGTTFSQFFEDAAKAN